MSRSFVPNGNITVSRFVKQDTSAVGGYVLQAGAGEKVIGVASQGTLQPPINGLDDGYAGVDGGPPIVVYTENDECWLELGGTVTADDLLKSDANGKGVTAGSDGDYYGARALESGTSGKLVRVKIETGYRGA